MLVYIGGKKWFIKKYRETFFPKKINNVYEPFGGSGLLSLYLSKKTNGKIYLSDNNFDVYCLYKSVKCCHKELLYKLNNIRAGFYGSDNYMDYFEKMVSLYNSGNTLSVLERAGILYFFSQCSIGSIARKNKNGLYNSQFNPDFYGNRQIRFPSFGELEEYSNILKNINIGCYDFMSVFGLHEKNDFVLIDPPYYMKTNYRYNNIDNFNKRYSELHDLVVNIDKVGARFMIFNYNTNFILNMFKDFNIKNIYRKSGHVNRDYNEVVITNY